MLRTSKSVSQLGKSLPSSQFGHHLSHLVNNMYDLGGHPPYDVPRLVLEQRHPLALAKNDSSEFGPHLEFRSQSLPLKQRRFS